MIEDNGYIYLHRWLILMVNVGKCASFMDSMGITLIPFFSFQTLTSMDIYQIQSHKRYIDSHMSKEILHSYEILVISWMNLVIYFYSQKLSGGCH